MTTSGKPALGRFLPRETTETGAGTTAESGARAVVVAVAENKASQEVMAEVTAYGRQTSPSEMTGSEELSESRRVKKQQSFTWVFNWAQISRSTGGLVEMVILWSLEAWQTCEAKGSEAWCGKAVSSSA